MWFITAVASLNIALWGFTALDKGNSWAFPLIVSFACYGIASSFNLVYVVHSDIFPTLFSATAMGICNFVARIMTCFAPEVAEIPGTTGVWVCTVMTSIAFFATFFLHVNPK